MADDFSEKKGHGSLDKDNGDPERLEEKGTVLGGERQSYDIGLSKDGVRLHPQPTADPLDPLNWSFAKKHAILAIVMYLSVVHSIAVFSEFGIT